MGGRDKSKKRCKQMFDFQKRGKFGGFENGIACIEIWV